LILETLFYLDKNYIFKDNKGMERRFEHRPEEISGKEEYETGKGLGRRKFLKTLGATALSLKLGRAEHQQTISPEMKERREKAENLKKYLESFAARGYEVKLEPKLLVRSTPRPKDKEKEFGFRPDQEKFLSRIVISASVMNSIERIKNPDAEEKEVVFVEPLPIAHDSVDQFVKDKLSSAEFVDPSLYEGGNVVTAPFFVIDSIPVEGKSKFANIRILSEATGTVFFEKEFEIFGNEEDSTTLSEEENEKVLDIAKEITQEFEALTKKDSVRSERESLQNLLKDANKRNLGSAVAPAEINTSGELKQQIKIFWNSWDVSFTFYPTQTWQEKRNKKSSTFDSQRIDKRKLKPISTPLRLSGELDHVAVEKYISVSGKEVTSSKEIKDKNGNHIKMEIIDFESDKREKGEPRKATQEIRIYPGTRFTKNKKTKFVPISADLSGLGFSDMPPILFVPEVPAVGEIGKYTVYSNFPRETSHYKTEMKRFGQGIKQGEALFGYSEGQAVKNISIVPKYSGGAGINKNFPETVKIGSDLMDKWHNAEPGKINPVAEAIETGRHEAIHVMSEEFSISTPELEKFFFDELPEEFLQLISEGKFLPMRREESGHAWQNFDEFFASFIVLCSEPLTPYVLKARKGLKIKEKLDPKEKREPKEWDFKQLFLLCLQKVEARFKQISKIPANAPIFELLQKRQNELKEI